MTVPESSFELYFDEQLTEPTPYNSVGAYLSKARDRIDRTFGRIAAYVPGQVVLDVGASPFYLLYQAKVGGARRCHGVYFAHDEHPLVGRSTVYCSAGPIEISHANAEVDRFGFAENEVDLLTACEILEHFDMFPINFAKEVRRVVRPGGHLCITVPNVSSIANILKLSAQRNIYMKYRSDSTGRHKHEYTMAQLRAFVDYLGFEAVDAGYFPSPTSDKYYLRPIYRALSHIPVLKGYSPVLYMVARQPDTKPTNNLDQPPSALFDFASSIEE